MESAPGRAGVPPLPLRPGDRLPRAPTPASRSPPLVRRFLLTHNLCLFITSAHSQSEPTQSPCRLPIPAWAFLAPLLGSRGLAQTVQLSQNDRLPGRVHQHSSGRVGTAFPARPPPERSQLLRIHLAGLSKTGIDQEDTGRETRSGNEQQQREAKWPESWLSPTSSSARRGCCRVTKQQGLRHVHDPRTLTTAVATGGDPLKERGLRREKEGGAGEGTLKGMQN